MARKLPWYFRIVLVLSLIAIGSTTFTFLSPHSAEAAVTRLQSVTGTANGATSVTATFGTAPVAPHLLVAVHHSRGTLGAQPTGWSTAITRTTNDGGGVSIFYKVSDGTESTALTISTSPSSVHQTLALFEYSGTAISSPLDVTASNTSGATQVGTLASGTTATTAQANELIIAAVGAEGGASFANTWTNSFTQISNVNTTAANPATRADTTAAQRIVTATGTFTTTETWGTNRRAGAAIVAFKAARPTQWDYRWYNNADSVQPGTARQNQTTADSIDCTKPKIRLRMSVWVGEDSWAASSKTLKLQYSTSTSGPWVDVGSDAFWAFQDNPTPADGAAITSLLLTGSTVLETYEEANNTTSNPVAITAGGIGEWDFSLDPTNVNTGTYYFKLVESSGTDLNYYYKYPQINVQSQPGSSETMRHGHWFSTGGSDQGFDRCVWVAP